MVCRENLQWVLIQFIGFWCHIVLVPFETNLQLIYGGVLVFDSVKFEGVGM